MGAIRFNGLILLRLKLKTDTNSFKDFAKREEKSVSLSAKSLLH
jgi:hypothetical protein